MNLARRVLARYLKADLSPPLGKPGGPCQVMQRIDKAIRNPAVKDEMIQEVSKGNELDPRDASRVYPITKEMGAGVAKNLELTAHLQYRMDWRSVSLDDVRVALRSLTLNLQRDPKMTADLQYGEAVRWIDPKTRLVIVVKVSGRDTLKLITTFWKGRPDPGGAPVNVCNFAR